MASPPLNDHDLTLLLRAAAEGEGEAAERFTELVYKELESMATGKLFGHYGAGAGALTLEPGALVNEGFLRVLRSHVAFENRAHFFSYVSKVMTNVMFDYQRRRSAEKRGAGKIHLTLSGAENAAIWPLDRVDELLTELEALDVRKAEVVRLRALWGLEVREVAELLEVSERTVERDWQFAGRWLNSQLSKDV